jgi:hypothetical protein
VARTTEHTSSNKRRGLPKNDIGAAEGREQEAEGEPVKD